MFSIVLRCLENIRFWSYPLFALTWYPFHLPQSQIFDNSAYEMMKRAHFILRFTREKIYLPRQNLSEFSLFLTIQNAERSKSSQIFSSHVSFWTTYKSTRSDAIPSISKTVVVVVAMLVLLLHSYKRRILIM